MVQLDDAALQTTTAKLASASQPRPTRIHHPRKSSTIAYKRSSTTVAHSTTPVAIFRLRAAQGSRRRCVRADIHAHVLLCMTRRISRRYEVKTVWTNKRLQQLFDVLAAPLWHAAHCDLRRFHQQKAQHRTPLFGDMPQPSPIAAGFFYRDQSQIARYLLARAKAFGPADDQHEGQCSQGTHSGMCPQSLRLRALLDFLLDRLTQLRDRRVQSIQQLQQVASPPG